MAWSPSQRALEERPASKLRYVAHDEHRLAKSCLVVDLENHVEPGLGVRRPGQVLSIPLRLHGNRRHFKFRVKVIYIFVLLLHLLLDDLARPHFDWVVRFDLGVECALKGRDIDGSLVGCSWHCLSRNNLAPKFLRY